MRTLKDAADTERAARPAFAGAGAGAGTACALCGRPLAARFERHHLVPRVRGGRETVAVHPICHRKIHSLFSAGELATRYATPEALRAHPEIAAFIAWLKGKPADFHKRTAPPRKRR